MARSHNNGRLACRALAASALGLAYLAVPGRAQPFVPDTRQFLAPLGTYDGYILQSFGNQTIGDTSVQRCGGPFTYGIFAQPQWPPGTPNPYELTVPFRQLATLLLEDYSMDFRPRPQVEALAYGGLQVGATQREYEPLRGVDVPANNQNILRSGFTGYCRWAEATPRYDGTYEITIVELGGTDWERNDPVLDVVDQQIVCNPLTYKGPLAALQPDWKNVPVCVEGGTDGKIKRWSRVHHYSLASVGGAAGVTEGGTDIVM